MPRRERSVTKIAEGFRVQIKDALATDSWPLFVFGPQGTGKTCAALCLADWFGGVYMTVTELCAMIIDAQQGRLVTSRVLGRRSPGREDTRIGVSAFWGLIENQDLIILDEIARRKQVSDAHYEAVRDMADARDCLPFVVTSNYGLDVIEDLYDATLASRLGAGTVVELRGSDRRLA